MPHIVSLCEPLKEQEKRKQIIVDAAQLLESEINEKKGLKGAVIKSAYIFIKTFKKDYIPHIMDLVIDELAVAIDPIHEEFRQNPEASSFKTLLCAQHKRASQQMLLAMDRRIKAANETIQKIYQKFRPQAQEHIVQALPRLALLVDKHTILVDNTEKS